MNFPSTIYSQCFFSDQDFTVGGKFGISRTDEDSVTGTRLHDQGNTGLCWNYTASSSVRKSLRIKIGKLFFAKTSLKCIKLLFQIGMERTKHSNLSIKVSTIKYSEKKFFLVYDQQLYQVNTFLSKMRLTVLQSKAEIKVWN